MRFEGIDTDFLPVIGARLIKDCAEEHEMQLEGVDGNKGNPSEESATPDDEHAIDG